MSLELLIGAGLGVGGGAWPSAAVFGDGDCPTAVGVATSDEFGTGDGEGGAFTELGAAAAAGFCAVSSDAVFGGGGSPGDTGTGLAGAKAVVFARVSGTEVAATAMLLDASCTSITKRTGSASSEIE